MCDSATVAVNTSPASLDQHSHRHAEDPSEPTGVSRSSAAATHEGEETPRRTEGASPTPANTGPSKISLGESSEGAAAVCSFPHDLDFDHLRDHYRLYGWASAAHFNGGRSPGTCEYRPVDFDEPDPPATPEVPEIRRRSASPVRTDDSHGATEVGTPQAMPVNPFLRRDRTKDPQGTEAKRERSKPPRLSHANFPSLKTAEHIPYSASGKAKYAPAQINWQRAYLLEIGREVGRKTGRQPAQAK